MGSKVKEFLGKEGPTVDKLLLAIKEALGSVTVESIPDG